MTSNNSVISEDMLENLTFTRSTWWSEFFESFSVREEGEIYDVEEIDETFLDDSLDEEQMEYCEGAEEDDAPEDIEHHSLLKAITLNEKISFVESSEIQDILNATLPVLEEHERKWKNAGLQSILNTFDSVRIKKEVGGWMRRNHSVTTTEVESDSSTDSSISFDTGNYIRTTKKMHMKSGLSRIESMRRLNSKQIRHNHGMIIEATRYRAYKCDCCNYNLNRAPKIQQSKIIEKQASQSMIASCSMSRPNSLNRDQFVSFKTTKYDTPPRSSPPKNNFINTAPPKITTKRMAALKARENLTKMHKTKSKNSEKMARIDRKQQTSESIKDFNLATITETNKPFSLSSEDFKENTFLTNVENICNSTALNGVAARKQLISRPPTITESSETIPSTPRDKGMPNQNNCRTTTSKCYAVANKCLPTIRKQSISLSDSPHRSKAGLKNIYKSKEPNLVNATRELEICSPPPEGRFSYMDTPHRSKAGLKNFYKSKEPNKVKATRELEICSTPPEGRFSYMDTPHRSKAGLKNFYKSNEPNKVKATRELEICSTPPEGRFSYMDTPHRSKAGLKNFYKSNEPNKVKATRELEQKTKSIKAFDPEEKRTLKSIDSVDLISSPSTTDSEEIVKTVRKPTKTPKTREFVKDFNLATITETNKPFSLPSENFKENTFLKTVENICNSTALNGVAARKQLISRPPTINESSGTIPSTPREKGMPNQNNCRATTSKCYAVANKCLPTISEHSISLSDSPHGSKAGLKNIYKSKESNEVKAGRELEICSSPPEEGRFSGTAIQDTPNPRYGKKEETIVRNERKSPVGASNVSPVRLNADTPTKSITQQRIDKRIPIYKPQQKQQTSDSNFEVTRELLSSVIGEEKARRFFKYNLGAVIFPITSTVYYCPPEKELCSSDSDDDPLDKFGRYGELNESVQHN
ncbi:uncharacterized protein LOC128855479 [Anastrepha ludens]|uniref:uncharacterized protein LOC128855479 n=1 Tax=Anastrepha ludens TaxID=28586 RepID=UPI0023AFD5DF|nr:uncharacterized protein LOC128855479 [Anastrepha ludens]